VEYIKIFKFSRSSKTKTQPTNRGIPDEQQFFFSKTGCFCIGTTKNEKEKEEEERTKRWAQKKAVQTFSNHRGQVLNST